MTRATVKIVPNARGMRELRERYARGMNAVVADAENAAVRETPVRGGYRSLAPGGPLGGTLRESVHSAVFLDGALFASTAKAGGPMPEMTGLPKVVVGYVGTNTGYGAYVELGTRKMQARPFLSLGLDEAMGRAGVTFARGMGRAKP